MESPLPPLIVDIPPIESEVMQSFGYSINEIQPTNLINILNDAAIDTPNEQIPEIISPSPFSDPFDTAINNLSNAYRNLRFEITHYLSVNSHFSDLISLIDNIIILPITYVDNVMTKMRIPTQSEYVETLDYVKQTIITFNADYMSEYVNKFSSCFVEFLDVLRSNEEIYLVDNTTYVQNYYDVIMG